MAIRITYIFQLENRERMMKNLIHILCIGFIVLGCSAQSKIVELSNMAEANYIFARIYPEKPIHKELYDGGLYLTIFKYSDSKITPENFSEGTEEFLDSYIISIVPDGDHYTTSKLSKIEGLLNPKILNIVEKKYPVFALEIEFGAANKRIVKEFSLVGSLN